VGYNIIEGLGDVLAGEGKAGFSFIETRDPGNESDDVFFHATTRGTPTHWARSRILTKS